MQTSGYGQGREQQPIRSDTVINEKVSNEGITGYLLNQPTVRNSKGKEFRFDALLGSGLALLTKGSVTLSPEIKKLVNQLNIKIVDISDIKPIQGKYSEVIDDGDTVLVRPDRLVFGHTPPAMSVDNLLSNFGEAVSCAIQS